MRIFVAGAKGQVARALAERGAALGAACLCHGRPDIDLATGAGLDERIEAERPAVIVNAAAYTAVDKAESEEAAAFAVNRDGAARLAAAAARHGIPFVHVSTDYVFDGAKPAPYVETDPTGPIGAYGRSKLAGEIAVLAACPTTVILRTAWVYSPFGGNFVATMLRLAGERDRLRVVDDQHGNPTSALDIADAVLAIAGRIAEGGAGRFAGVYHLAGTGDTTWCGFARAIVAAAAERGHRSVPVDAIATADFPTPARRPANSRLDTSKLRSVFGLTLPHWQTSLVPIIDRLVRP